MTTPAPMSPGAYLRRRREAGGWSLDALALVTETTPPVSSRSRQELLALIEADEQPVTGDVVDTLADAFRLDRHVLIQLVALHAGAAIEPPRLCRRCACSWNGPCADASGAGCAWSTEDGDLCTSCIVAEAEASFAPVRDRRAA